MLSAHLMSFYMLNINNIHEEMNKKWLSLGICLYTTKKIETDVTLFYSQKLFEVTQCSLNVPKHSPENRQPLRVIATTIFKSKFVIFLFYMKRSEFLYQIHLKRVICWGVMIFFGWALKCMYRFVSLICIECYLHI